MVILIPDSCRWRLSTLCPFRPVMFLHNGRSAKSAFHELGFYEAAVGDPTLPDKYCRNNSKEYASRGKELPRAGA